MSGPCSTDSRGPDSTLGWLLLSFLCASRVFLFSPPLTQKLFLKSISFQLSLAQSDWEQAWPGLSVSPWRSGKPASLWGLPELWTPQGCCGWESVCLSFSAPKGRETNILLQPEVSTSLLVAFSPKISTRMAGLWLLVSLRTLGGCGGC